MKVASGWWSCWIITALFFCTKWPATIDHISTFKLEECLNKTAVGDSNTKHSANNNPQPLRLPAVTHLGVVMRFNEKELVSLSRQPSERAAELGMKGPKKGDGNVHGHPHPCYRTSACNSGQYNLQLCRAIWIWIEYACGIYHRQCAIALIALSLSNVIFRVWECIIKVMIRWHVILCKRICYYGTFLLLMGYRPH